MTEKKPEVKPKKSSQTNTLQLVWFIGWGLCLYSVDAFGLRHTVTFDFWVDFPNIILTFFIWPLYAVGQLFPQYHQFILENKNILAIASFVLYFLL